jgi:hypothetical protein
MFGVLPIPAYRALPVSWHDILVRRLAQKSVRGALKLSLGEIWMPFGHGYGYWPLSGITRLHNRRRQKSMIAYRK